MAGYMTFVVRYEDYAELQQTEWFKTAFEWFRRERGERIRITASSQDDEMTRAKKLEEAIGKYRDRAELEDAVDRLVNTACVADVTV